MTGFARVMELEAEDREVRRIERESLRAGITGSVHEHKSRGLERG